MSCTNDLHPGSPSSPPGAAAPERPADYAWTDLTYLLHKHHVSWALLRRQRAPSPTATTTPIICVPVTAGAEDARVSGIRCRTSTPSAQDDQLGQHRSRSRSFYAAAEQGTLPAVSWIMPTGTISEHPPRPSATGRPT